MSVLAKWLLGLAFNAVGGWRGIAVAVVTATIAAGSAAKVASLYDAWVDDPAVRKAALAGYVAQAELAAANARHAETLRQLEIARNVNRMFAEDLAAARAAEEAANEAREQDIADYEKRLAENGRACLLDGADIDWLRQ